MLAARDLGVAGRLKGVSCTLVPGTVTALCGPNGAGKSSLLAALAGLLAPQRGSVMLADAPLATLPPRQRACALGYLAQNGAVAWNLTVATLVGLGRLPHRAGAAADAAAVAQALAALDLTALATRPIAQLSGGERARALLARVLAGEPRWLLADEPLAALDLGAQQAVLAQFRQRAVAGAGVVLVLHDLALARNHADRVIVLSEGRVAADAPPVEALSPEVIARVWGVRARWHGAPGAEALGVGGAIG